MVTLNEHESLWSVQILVKALTTGQNADGHYYWRTVLHVKQLFFTVQGLLSYSCIDFPG